jgi:uncharacterized protein (DUF2062 family)
VTIRHRRPRRRPFVDRVWRLVRYKLLVPVFRSRHSPEYVARGVANGVFWGLTPSIGLQTIEIVGTWFIARRVFGRDSSLLQALIWVWVNNPVTMVPMFYVFYVTGLWMTGASGPIGGYDTFTHLWEKTASLGWMDRAITLAREIGLPMAVGSVPYAAIGAAMSYRWALKVVRHRQHRIRTSGATLASIEHSADRTGKNGG